MVLVWVVWRFDYKLTMSKERHGRFDYKIFESANSLSNWIESSIAVWRHSCTMSFIGWTCQRGSPTRWVSWCTAVFTVRHLGTSPTISSHPLTLLRGFVCVPQTDTSSSYLAVDSTHTVAGRFRSLVRRSGTRCLTISEIRRVVLTALSSFLRQSCFVFTNVTSALEVFLKCYALYKSTFYLLTYLLTYLLSVRWKSLVNQVSK